MPVELGTLQDHTSFVGEGVVAPGTTLMFCNGINNPTVEDAKTCARVVSAAFSGRRVEIFHNPTSWGNVIDSDLRELDAQWDLAELFAQAIQQQIQTQRGGGIEDRDIRILVFVHSHGARVVKDAIEELSEEDQRCLHIYGFGGAQMLPRKAGAVVENYVHDGDSISSGGNIITSRRNEESLEALNAAEQIHKGMADGKTFDATLFDMAWRDLFMHLSPLMSGGDGDKQRRYELIIEQHNQEALTTDPFFIQQVSKYTDLFQRYAIAILPGTPFVEPEFTPMKRHSSRGEFFGNLPGNLFSMLGNTAVGIGAMARHGLDNHNFESYSPMVTQIAMRYVCSCKTNNRPSSATSRSCETPSSEGLKHWNLRGALYAPLGTMKREAAAER